MKIDQSLCDRILKRAQASMYGCGEPETSFKINAYTPQDLNALAQMLVGAFHGKYDLISIFLAAMEEFQSNSVVSIRSPDSTATKEGERG